MAKIVIEVEGGMVRTVYADAPDVEVIIVDRDILADPGDLVGFQSEYPAVLVLNSAAENWDTGVDRLMIDQTLYPHEVW